MPRIEREEMAIIAGARLAEQVIAKKLKPIPVDKETYEVLVSSAVDMLYRIIVNIWRWGELYGVDLNRIKEIANKVKFTHLQSATFMEVTRVQYFLHALSVRYAKYLANVVLPAILQSMLEGQKNQRVQVQHNQVSGAGMKNVVTLKLADTDTTDTTVQIGFDVMLDLSPVIQLMNDTIKSLLVIQKQQEGQQGEQQEGQTETVDWSKVTVTLADEEQRKAKIRNAVKDAQPANLMLVVVNKITTNEGDFILKHQNTIQSTATAIKGWLEQELVPYITQRLPRLWMFFAIKEGEGNKAAISERAELPIIHDMLSDIVAPVLYEEVALRELIQIDYNNELPPFLPNAKANLVNHYTVTARGTNNPVLSIWFIYDIGEAINITCALHIPQQNKVVTKQISISYDEIHTIRQTIEGLMQEIRDEIPNMMPLMRRIIYGENLIAPFRKELQNIACQVLSKPIGFFFKRQDGFLIVDENSTSIVAFSDISAQVSYKNSQLQITFTFSSIEDKLHELMRTAPPNLQAEPLPKPTKVEAICTLEDVTFISPKSITFIVTAKITIDFSNGKKETVNIPPHSTTYRGSLIPNSYMSFPAKQEKQRQGEDEDVIIRDRKAFIVAIINGMLERAVFLSTEILDAYYKDILNQQNLPGAANLPNV